ncbi:ABC transporter ATP-binding protein [Anaerofilum sp. BX8]|uniref:ABC transporter ATP-binding protein n=2 Tax=Anaerofilum hominis TaxID=2763016 RepID=A0A923L1Q6_9FIRM|nr:ABC transporter ATP-binding protein [Anaerofilum hominis]
MKQVQSMIKVEHLRKVYRTGKEKVLALADINLELAKGEFCCIVGASGSGKSTLLNQLAGLEKPTRGTVVIDGENISAMSENQLAAFRQQKLGFVFQSYNLLPTMTAVENVALPLMFKGIPKRKREKMAKEQLKKMGLGKRAHHKPTEMSGGQQQRVGIARAFVSKPAVIFADEPTGNLDSHTTVQVMNAILKLIRENNITFVMVTHERDLAACADRIITLRDGLVLRDERMDHPQEAYTVPEGQEDADLDDKSWDDSTGKAAAQPAEGETGEGQGTEIPPPLAGQAQQDETLAQISETIRRAKEKAPAAPVQTNQKIKENSTHE